MKWQAFYQATIIKWTEFIWSLGATTFILWLPSPVAPEFGFSSTTFSGSEASGQVVATISVTNGVSLSLDFTITLQAQISGGPDGATFCKEWDSLQVI